MTEVRLTHLRPSQLAERRAGNNVAWLPLGTLEWHGRHLPLGFDGLKAEGICVRAARRFGGVVFPATYLGDHRGVTVEALLTPGVVFVPDLDRDHRPEIAAALGTSVDVLAAQGRRDEETAASARHTALLLQALWTIRSYGYTTAVLLAGHYPNAVPAGEAAAEFAAAQTTCQVLVGTELAFAGRPEAVRHADSYETSLALALLPDLVDTGAMDGTQLGIMGDDPRSATPELGERLIGEVLDGIAAQLAALRPVAAPRELAGDVDEDGTSTAWPSGRWGSDGL